MRQILVQTVFPGHCLGKTVFPQPIPHEPQPISLSPTSLAMAGELEGERCQPKAGEKRWAAGGFPWPSHKLFMQAEAMAETGSHY